MGKKIKRSVTTTTIKGETGFISAIVEYDQNGNTIREEEYLGPNELQSRILSTYDDQNRLIEQKQFTEEEGWADHRIIHRNEAGEVEKTEVRFPDGSISMIFEKSNPDNRTTEVIEEDEEGELEGREVNHLNENKQLALREIFNFNNKLSEAFRYEYDDAGQLVRREQLDRKKKLVLYTLFEYDEKGQTIKRANYNRKNKLSDFLTIEYDEKGQVTRQNFSGQFSIVFEYDDQGNTILEERYRADGELEYQSRFEYNEEGKVVKETNQEFTKETTWEYF